MNIASIASTTINQSLPIQKGKHDFHVVPQQGYWAVKGEHNDAYSGYWLTQLEATAYAIDLARRSAASVIIHGEDGRFREVLNYDNYRGPDLD